MRILEGTVEEIVAYERAHGSMNGEHVVMKPEQQPPIEQDKETAAAEMVHRKFNTPRAEFALAYMANVEALGARLDLATSSKSTDGWVDYLRFVVDVGAKKVPVAFIQKTQAKFALTQAEFVNIGNPRVRPYDHEGEGQPFEAIIPEPTKEELDLALELTRRAVAKVQQS